MYHQLIFSNTGKILGVVFCFVLAFFMGASLVSFVAADSAVPGDANFDGVVEAVDVQLVVNAALGIDIGDYDADTNNDHVIDAIDVQLVINATLGIDINGAVNPETWQLTFHVRGGHDEASAVQQSDDGGFVVAGTIRSFEGISDMYLVKTDPSGNGLWSKAFGGSLHDRAKAMQQTDDGGFILAGYTSSFGAGRYDMYLVKTDSSGNELWSKTFGGSEHDKAFAVQQTDDGGFVLAGETEPFGQEEEDVLLVRTDASGNELWSNTFGGSEDEYAKAVQQTDDGGFVMVGKTTSFGAGKADFYLVKTDSNGNELWSKTFGGSEDDYGKAVQQTDDGGFALAGSTSSFGVDRSHMYLVKTDASGNELWSKTFSGNVAARAYAMQQTDDGGFVLAGYNVTSSDPLAGDQLDIYLVKTDANGNELWSNIIGGNDYDTAYAVQQTDDGGFVLAGKTWSFGAEDFNIYVVKTDADGNSPDPPE